MQVIKKLIPKKEFILMLSCGWDSMASAIYFKNRGYKFVAFHFNGNFIHQDAITARSVTDFCWNNQISLIVESGVNNYTKGSKENYCRQSRYKALSKTCKEFDLHDVVTAHNLNDCVTSYVWRCLKGEASYNPIPFETHFDSFKLSRPFLLTSKNELKEYARKAYSVIENYVVEDDLNKDLSLTRNFIREKVLPLIHTKKHFNLNKVVKKIVEKNLKKHLDEKYMIE